MCEEEIEVYGPRRWNFRNEFIIDENSYFVAPLSIEAHMRLVLNKLDNMFKCRHPELCLRIWKDPDDKRQLDDYERILELKRSPAKITLMERIFCFLWRKEDERECKSERDFYTNEETRNFYYTLQYLVKAKKLYYENRVEEAWGEIAKAQHCCGKIFSHVLNDYRNADLPERLFQDVEKPIKQKQNRNSHISRAENNARISNLAHNLLRERNKTESIDEAAIWVHEQLNPPKEVVQAWLKEMPDGEKYFKDFKLIKTEERLSHSYSKLVKEEVYFLIRQNYDKSKCPSIERAVSELLDKRKRFASSTPKNHKRLKQPTISTLKKYILKMPDQDKYINVVTRRKT